MHPYVAGALTASNSSFTENTAAYGGAIYVLAGGKSMVSNLTFSANIGGAIYNDGEATVSHSTFSGNHSWAGGAIFSGNALTVSNSTFSGNTAIEDGGAICIFGGTLTAVNVTLTGNRPDSDGNNTPGAGGALFAGGTVVLRNTLIAGNFRGTGPTPDDIAGSVSSASNTIVADPATAGGLSHGANGNIVGKDHDNNPGTARVLWPTAEILNTTLANNGGPTRTHGLVANSPALNAGSNANIPVGTTTDQRGAARIADTTLEIGAVEMQPQSLVFDLAADEDDGNTAVGDLSARRR